MTRELFEKIEDLIYKYRDACYWRSDESPIELRREAAAELAHLLYKNNWVDHNV